MIVFLLKASFIVGIGLLFYKIVLQQESFFATNRFYLICCFVLALSLPYLELPKLIDQQGYLSTFFQTDHKNTFQEPLGTINYTVTKPVTEADNQPQISPIESARPKIQAGNNTAKLPTDWGYWLTMLYLFGVGVFALNLVFQLVNIFWKVFRSTDKIEDGKFIIVNTKKEQAPCSFFRYIFIQPDDYDFETYEQIIEHEKIHASLWHSIDLLIAEIGVILFWFNPLMWLLRKEVEKNIEYQTDAILLSDGKVEKEQYQMNLIQIAVPHKPLQMTTNYNQSLLKQRIHMMNAKKSTIHGYWKYTFLLPVFFGAVLLLNEPANGQVNLTLLTQAPDSAPPKAEAKITTPTPEQEKRSWTATIEGQEACFHFMTAFRTDTHHRGNWNTSECFQTSDFSNLPTNGTGEFYLQREAGKLMLKGQFTDGEGVGTFTFEPSAGFVKALDKEGFSNYSNNELIQFFFADMQIGYIRELKAQNYRPDREELLQLAVFQIKTQDLDQLLALLKKLGIEKPDLDQLIQLKIHNIDLAYIQELQKAGYKNLELDDIIAAKIHDVDAEYVQEMQKAGFENLSLEETSQMAVHDIDPSYIQKLEEMGFKNLSADEIFQAKIFNITPAFLEELKKMGFATNDLEEVTQFAIHDVSPELIEALRKTGYDNLSSEELLQAAIHNISAEHVQKYKEMGFDNLSFEEMVGFKIHRVTPELINGLKEAGYDNLSPDEYLQAAIHNIKPAFAKKYKDMGFENLSFERMIEFKIHRITPEFMAGLKELGYDDLSADQYVEASVHGITPEFIREYQEIGFTDLSFERLVELKIHNITPEFLKKNYKGEKAK